MSRVLTACRASLRKQAGGQEGEEERHGHSAPEEGHRLLVPQQWELGLLL